MSAVPPTRPMPLSLSGCDAAGDVYLGGKKSGAGIAIVLKAGIFHGHLRTGVTHQDAVAAIVARDGVGNEELGGGGCDEFDPVEDIALHRAVLDVDRCGGVNADAG